MFPQVYPLIQAVAAGGQGPKVGNDGAINLGNGDFIVLHGVSMANLTANDFIVSSAGEVVKSSPQVPVSLAAGDATHYSSQGLSDWLPLHGEVFV